MAKHEKSFVDFDKPYEKNLIGLRGIIIFTVGLFFLIVITFALMWVLEVQMEDYAVETKDTRNPMIMNQQERLPPEPRLQSAPGFGVQGQNDRINLELTERWCFSPAVPGRRPSRRRNGGFCSRCGRRSWKRGRRTRKPEL